MLIRFRIPAAQIPEPRSRLIGDRSYALALSSRSQADCASEPPLTNRVTPLGIWEPHFLSGIRRTDLKTRPVTPGFESQSCPLSCTGFKNRSVCPLFSETTPIDGVEPRITEVFRVSRTRLAAPSKIAKVYRRLTISDLARDDFLE